mmetsp:Transcript_29945/g.63120  ORF Transcript_29945/g.63120 Transcript_29945/m.63120 type:complete len:372 (+) Transcript_29945:578-1693(+)
MTYATAAGRPLAALPEQHVAGYLPDVVRLSSSQLPDDRSHNCLAVSHLLDPHLLEGVHELLLAVAATHDVLEQLERRHLLLDELLGVLLQFQIGEHRRRVGPTLRRTRPRRRRRACGDSGSGRERRLVGLLLRLHLMQLCLQVKVGLVGAAVVAEDEHSPLAERLAVLHGPVRRERRAQRRGVELVHAEGAREQVEAARLHELADGAEHLHVLVDALLIDPLCEIEAVQRDLLVHEQRRRHGWHLSIWERVHHEGAARTQGEHHPPAVVAAETVDRQARHHLSECVEQLGGLGVVAQHVRRAELSQHVARAIEPRVVGDQVDAPDLEHLAQLDDRLSDRLVCRVLDDRVPRLEAAVVLEEAVGGAERARAR